MSLEVIAALITGACTITGSGLAVLAAQKLTLYRITQLERLVERHNRTLERINILDVQMNEVLAALRRSKEGLL